MVLIEQRDIADRSYRMYTVSLLSLIVHTRMVVAKDLCALWAGEPHLLHSLQTLQGCGADLSIKVPREGSNPPSLLVPKPFSPPDEVKSLTPPVTGLCCPKPVSSSVQWKGRRSTTLFYSSLVLVVLIIETVVVDLASEMIDIHVRIGALWQRCSVTH